ncbi:hypothetical protein HYV10_02030 [Candidatus Dependentiae bacterium]|nr:hypothetical protein [Candidatus Dependentiae bacterium]
MYDTVKKLLRQKWCFFQKYIDFKIIKFLIFYVGCFMRLEIIQSIQFIIIAFLCYVPTVTFSGWFEAWISKKCGDDTPEQFGFLTFNPFAHFSIFGFGALLAGRLLSDYLPFLQDIPGWGRYIPVSPSEFSKERAVIQFHARGFSHFVLTAISFVALVEFIKLGYLNIHWKIADHTSASVASIIQVAQFFNSLNFMLAIIYLAIGTFRSVVFYKWPDFYIFFAERFILAMFILFSVVVVCAEIFRLIITTILTVILYSMIG